MARSKYLIRLIPLGILIVAVTTWARWLGGLYAVILPPAFAIGSAALLGRFLQRRLAGKARDDGPF